MRNDYLHTRKTAKKLWERARLVFGGFCVIAAVTLVGVALAADSGNKGTQAGKSQTVAENSGNSQNPIAEKYSVLVMRVYFNDRAERDQLALELQAEEVPTTGGYLTVIRDRALYYNLLARGLRVEIDENSSRNLSDYQLQIDTFFGGYKSVEEI